MNYETIEVLKTTATIYIRDIPPDGGGDTMFDNMYQAYETLSEPLRTMLDGLTAIHYSWKAHSTQARRASCAELRQMRVAYSQYGDFAAGLKFIESSERAAFAYQC